MNSKKFNIISIAIFISAITIIICTTIVVDPYFHFHAPLDNLGYLIDYNDGRYQNDGLIKHFEYDALIIGTSMALNFKTSEVNDLFDVNSAKAIFFGGPYKEIGDNLQIALENKSGIKMIIRGLDVDYLTQDKDALFAGVVEQGFQYPTYLTDNDWKNDISYLLNKSILRKTLGVLFNTAKGNTTAMDYPDSCNYTWGKEAVLSTYVRPKKMDSKKQINFEIEKTVRDNIDQNVIELAKQYPDVEFYCYLTPYSICYWDTVNQRGEIDYDIEVQKIAIEEILKSGADNIFLFSFFENYEMICNLDNYKDRGHYGEWINSAMLKWMRKGEYQLTEQNYIDYINNIKHFYTSYDYDNIYK